MGNLISVHREGDMSEGMEGFFLELSQILPYESFLETDFLCFLFYSNTI